MRVLAVFLLLGALPAAGCQAPGWAPEGSDPPAVRMAPPQPPPQRALPPGWPAEVVAVPEGLPADGIGVRQAFNRHDAHEVWVLGKGTVERLMRDDTKAPRHQRFVVRVTAEQSVMIAHNIDVAPRVPFKRGDTIAFRGQYVWNAQGGVVHWTHRKRGDKKSGGWIVWKGQVFR